MTASLPYRSHPRSFWQVYEWLLPDGWYHARMEYAMSYGPHFLSLVPWPYAPMELDIWPLTPSPASAYTPQRLG